MSVLQRLTLVGGYPGGVWTCAWCAAELTDCAITHRDDCRFTGEVAAAERGRILQFLDNLDDGSLAKEAAGLLREPT